MRFLVVLAGVPWKAKPAGQRRECWTLHHERQQDYGKGDEDDLRTRWKWRTRYRRERKRERDDQGIAATHACPADECNPSPWWKLQGMPSEPRADHSAKVRAGNDPEHAHDYDTNTNERRLLEERHQRVVAKRPYDVRQLEPHENEDETLEHERHHSPHGLILKSRLGASNVTDLTGDVHPGGNDGDDAGRTHEVRGQIGSEWRQQRDGVLGDRNRSR